MPAPHQRILELLTQVAPDIDPASVDPALEFRRQFDFDSMDMLHFAIALSTEYGIQIPEADYPHLRSLELCATYIERAARGSNAAK